ncbi:hypothetical protein [Kitasatospora sp. NPDC094016]|uniref:hypothetical protein n=1 Tax=Kitasatospora sp. NPDC094016 TaxID=3154986 RepID=UPI00331F08F8
MSESPGTVAPQTTWEHCLSAADELTREQAPPDTRQHKRVVVLLAAVLAACAEGAGQVGAQIADLPMNGPVGVLDRLETATRWSVHACPAVPGLGAEQLEELLADCEVFRTVRDVAEGIVRQHLAAAPPGTVPTVRECATAAAAARGLQHAALALGIEQED